MVKCRPWILLLLPLLVLHLTGCTTARELSLPGATDDPAHASVKVGKRVTVHLVDGEKITGDVLAVTPDGLTLGKAGNYGWQETPVAAERIDRIEIHEVTDFARAMLVVTGVAIVVTLIVGAMYASALSGMGTT